MERNRKSPQASAIAFFEGRFRVRYPFRPPSHLDVHRVNAQVAARGVALRPGDDGRARAPRGDRLEAEVVKRTLSCEQGQEKMCGGTRWAQRGDVRGGVRRVGSRKNCLRPTRASPARTVLQRAAPHLTCVIRSPAPAYKPSSCVPKLTYAVPRLARLLASRTTRELFMPKALKVSSRCVSLTSGSRSAEQSEGAEKSEHTTRVPVTMGLEANGATIATEKAAPI